MEAMISQILNQNGSDQKRKMEVVSAETLAAILDLKVKTIYNWVSLARTKPSPDSIPFRQLPGKRTLRFNLREVKEWLDRGSGRTY